MRSLIAVLLSCVFVLPACAPVLVGMLIHKSTKSKQQQREWSIEFQKTNVEREAAGLEPLEWCPEAYRFDEGWAKNDKGCEARIKRYEAGETVEI